ncbi:unnamed protein product [Microthlaspi erraticum]|uniref:Uncharacterized protein n=1 Tax=Microthlaspi erraticum TaxID=1685480 RepID=A0A6D2KZR5_9BRAS|nr:unnamed protein product [Microthlaspi erraticum]
MTLGVIVPDLRASSPELELELLSMEQRLDRNEKDIAWIKEALSFILKCQGLEVPPFLVAVVREEDQTTKTVTEEVVLPLGHTAEHVASDSFQVPLVLVGEKKVKPVEHFVNKLWVTWHMKQIRIQADSRARA